MWKPWRLRPFSSKSATGCPIAVVTLFFLSIPLTGDAQFTYRNDEGTATITAYTGAGGDVVIPAEIDGLPVVSLTSSALSYVRSMNSVSIPSSLTNLLGGGPFSGCTSLTNITVDPSNERFTSVEGVLFDKDVATLVQYPAGRPGPYAIPPSVVTVGDSAFSGAFLLSGVSMPEGVETIQYDAFGSCSGLTDIVIPDSVTLLGRSAFYYCLNLTNINLGNGISTIGDRAFWRCASLKRIHLPNTVTNIGISPSSPPFGECESLVEIDVAPANPVFSSVEGVLFDKAITTLIKYPQGKQGAYIVPEGVTTLRRSAMLGSAHLTEVTLPSSLTSMASSALSRCASLTAIHVSGANNHFASVDGVLFDKTMSMLIQYPAGKTGVYEIPTSVTVLGDEAFTACALLSEVIIPEGFGAIPSSAFFACTGLGTLRMPSSVTNIGDWAMTSCIGLTNIFIPASVTTIGGGAFSICSALTNFVVESGNPRYSSADGVLFDGQGKFLQTFPGGKTGTYAIPDGVEEIGYNAFSWCFGLTNIVIPGSVTNIGNSAFTFCTNLTVIHVPAGVLRLGDSAFHGCHSLASVTFGEGFQMIDSLAFANCTKLRTLYFEGDAPMISYSVFSATEPVTVFYLPGAAGWGSSFGGQPTVIWDPQIPPEGVRVESNQFEFDITAAEDLEVAVQACADLTSPEWLGLGTVQLDGGSARFTDSDWAGRPARYYRLRMP